MISKIILRKKYNKATIILILIYSIYLVGCNNSTSNLDIEYYKSQNEELRLKNLELNEIIKNYNNNENIKSNSIKKSNSEVLNILHVKEIDGTYYIVLTVKSNDVDSNGVQLWKYSKKATAALLVEGIDINIETRNEFLYCTVLKNEGNNEYVEEVLKFDSKDNHSQIYQGKNVEISASTDGEYFIIIENPENQIELTDINLKNIRNLKVLDKNDKIIYDEVIPSKLHTELEPIGWNSSIFWATFNYAGGHPEFLIFDAGTLNYEIIENKADYFESELNIKTGWICYSDFPQFRDIDAYNEFKKSDKEVNLFLYNIFTDKNINIKTSIAKSFSPKWIDDYTFEYNNPSNDQKVLYELNSNN